MKYQHSDDRIKLAQKRILSILSRHVIANARTLEQKIADSGPFNQRIDPHVLTGVRNDLVAEGSICRIMEGNAPWFHLPHTPQATVERRLNEQLSVFRRLQHGNTGSRVGQCLEIAIYRALLRQDKLEHLGCFSDPR